MKKVFYKSYLLFTIATVNMLISCSSTKSLESNVNDRANRILPKASSLYAETPASFKNKKGLAGSKHTLSTIAGKPYLGIGLILDSANGLSRSFALFELFQNHLLFDNADTLYPVMVDYPFNSPHAITGVFNENNAKFKIYRNGKKVKEITAMKDWKDIYLKIGQELTSNKDFKLPPKFRTVSEGAVDNVDARNIKDCLPGSIALLVPYSKILDTVRAFANVKYYSSGDPYINNKELFGKYNTYKENKLFFFRNDNIPYNLKNAAKPLVFPLCKSLAPCLTYLSSGKILTNEQDYGASLNSYYSALVTSNNILASPFERALIRKLIYSEVSKTHQLLSSSRLHSALLFQLGADLNKAYLDSDDARAKRNEYYTNISKIENLCTKAEDKAREIRGQKRLGGILAAISYAGALSSVSAYDNTASDALMSQAETYFTTSMDQASSVSVALAKQYENIEDKINAESFVTSDGSAIELGKSFLAGEICYYMTIDPESVKNVLLAYASGKHRLLSLMHSFYSDQKNDSTVRDIFFHVSEMEAKMLNAEVRNIPLTEKILSTF